MNKNNYIFPAFFSVLLYPFTLGGTGPRSQQQLFPSFVSTFGALVVIMPNPEKDLGSSDQLEDALLRLINQNMYLGESVHALTLQIKELL